MKLLTKTTLLSIAVLGLLGAGQADASVKLNCVDHDSDNGFSILLPKGQNAGNAVVVLSGGQKFVGSFTAKVIGGQTRW